MKIILLMSLLLFGRPYRRLRFGPRANEYSGAHVHANADGYGNPHADACRSASVHSSGRRALPRPEQRILYSQLFSTKRRSTKTWGTPFRAAC